MRRLQVLIFALDNWAGTATLPKAFVRAGADVFISCPGHTYLSLTRFRQRWIPHGSTRGVRGPVAELRHAIQACSPDLVIPGDEASLDVMIAISDVASIGATEEELSLIRRSCGNPRFYSVGRNKRLTLEAAREAGVTTPAFAPVALVADALEFADEWGYPVVMKPDIGVGGIGVKFCEDEDELAGACTRLQGTWTANQYIEGVAAGSAAAAWAGKTVGGMAYVKIWSNPHPTGPATVIQMSDHTGMVDATIRLVEAFGAAGFFAPGFMIGTDGKAYLTEVNARYVSSCSIGHLVNADVCQALVNAFLGRPTNPTWPAGQVVMFFPQERLRDSASRPEPGWIEDIPTDDPELDAAYEANIARLGALTRAGA